MKKLNCASIFVICFTLFLLGCSSDSKTLKLNPKTLDFGNVNLAEFSELNLDIINKLGKDITITNMDISGSYDYSIVSTGSVPAPMAKGETKTITIRFEPVNSGTANGLLTIKINETTKDYAVTLVGNGVPVPRIEVPVKSYDFGKILNNTTDSVDFTVNNVGTADLTLDQISLIGAGATAYSITSGASTPIVINAGVSHKISVQFAPLVDGNYSASLSINHDGVNESSPVDITIDGEGISLSPEITLSEQSPWDVGTGSIANSSLKSFEISSTGIHDLTVSSITFANGTEFALDHIEDSNGNPITLPATITVSDKITVYIEFSPTVITTYNDTMSIVHDGINESSPLDVAISGTGKNPQTTTINYTGSIINWTVPAGVTTIEIEAWGAEGSNSTSSVYTPGLGARMKGTFTVSPGDTLKILVGQHLNSTGGNGGGGGTFVCKSNNDPLIIAGAGGGSARTTDSTNKHGNTTTTGGTGAAGGGAGGTNGSGGNAGTTSWNAGAGGGLLTNGQDGSSSGYGGRAFVNGGAGGGGTTGAAGGFGGGGRGSSYVVGGGGGGYSGGGGGGNSSAGVGGGGGSFNGGTNQSNTGGVNTGHGKVEITY